MWNRVLKILYYGAKGAYSVMMIALAALLLLAAVLFAQHLATTPDVPWPTVKPQGTGQAVSKLISGVAILALLSHWAGMARGGRGFWPLLPFALVAVCGAYQMLTYATGLEVAPLQALADMLPPRVERSVAIVIVLGVAALCIHYVWLLWSPVPPQPRPQPAAA